MDLEHKEEKLTLLITRLFDWIEKSQPEELYYGNVCLRGALERYFYFEAIAQPEKLSPLLSVAQQWRLNNQNAEQSIVYDYYHKLASERSCIKKLRDNITMWLRILGDYVNYTKSQFQFYKRGINKTKSEGGKKIGFFSINERFVHFFQTVDQKLEQEEKVYFSSHHHAVMASRNAQSNRVFVMDEKTCILFSALSLSYRNELFPVYFRLCFFYQRISTALMYWQPEVLLFAEGTSHYDELASQAASQLNITTIRLQSGRAGVLHSGYRNMSYDHMLCWSQSFVSRYKLVSPKPDYHVVGSPLMDEFFQYEEQKASKGAEKWRVLIITQPISLHIHETDYQELIDLSKALLSLRCDIELVVRMHPVDNFAGFELLSKEFPEQIIFMNPTDYSLASVFSVVNCCVGFFSTVLSEAAACGVPPILIQSNSSHSVYPHPEKYGAAIVVSNSKEATDEVLGLLQNNNKHSALKEDMRYFSKLFFGPDDGQSLNRMIDFIQCQLIEAE